MPKNISPLTPKEQAEAEFILMLLECQFGGVPALGVAPTNQFIVVPTCVCGRCQEFRKTYPVKPCSTMLEAAKRYGDDRLCFMQTKEAMDAGESVH